VLAKQLRGVVGRLFALSWAGMFLPFWPQAHVGIRRGSGGAVLLTQAPQNRREAAILGATGLSRSPTTDLTALLSRLAALR